MLQVGPLLMFFPIANWTAACLTPLPWGRRVSPESIGQAVFLGLEGLEVGAAMTLGAWAKEPSDRK